jgi:hypothetical protein
MLAWQERHPVRHRSAGTLSIPGVCGGLIDKIPFGAAMN